ncbi:MAG: HK97 family phage prohead protease [Rhizomicrobium sp.]
MTMRRALFRAEVSTTGLGDDEVRITMSTSALARDGDILVPQGCVLENYRTNPIVLWQHKPDFPVATAEQISIEANQISALVRFAPLGVSQKADEVRGLVKAGIVRGISVGFEPLETEPLDPKKPRGGQRITKWELLENSFVSIPADTGAVVTARAEGTAKGTNDMPEDTIQPHIDVVPPDAVPRAKTRGHGRTLRFSGAAIARRSLYDIGELAWLLANLGSVKTEAEVEAALEGDDSEVPAMLGEALVALGEALIAMTAEEVGELLASAVGAPEGSSGGDGDEGDELLSETDRAYVRAAKTPVYRCLRRGMVAARMRASKPLPKDTVRALRDALDAHSAAMTKHREAMRCHRGGMDTIEDILERCGVCVDDDTRDDGAGDDGKPADPGNADTDETTDRSAEDFRRRQADMARLNNPQ